MKSHLVLIRSITGIMPILCVTTCLAGLKAVQCGDTLVDANALTIQGHYGQAINGKSFQQDAMVSHKGYQYVGYYDGGRHVCIGRRKLPSGDWEIIRFQDYDFTSNDAHNTISIGICPKDGTIHIAFDHHVHPLHYRKSVKGVAHDPEKVKWDALLFGPVISKLEKDNPKNVTYPRFLQTPDGGLQFIYRRDGSGNGDRKLVDYDPETGSWKNLHQIDSRNGVFEDTMGSSKTRCSYPNGYTYGPDGKLHTTWVWRESSQGANHDLIYVYSEDRGNTWLNNAGEKISGPPRVDSPGVTVAEIPRTLGLMNTHGQAVDSMGRVHVVMWHCTEESLKAAGSKPGEHTWGVSAARRYHYYRRELNGEWKHLELPWVAGNRPKVFVDKDDNLFLIYRSDAKHKAEGLIKASGDLQVAAATAASGWKEWRRIGSRNGPFVNEMLLDPYRWKESGILSIMVQDSPANPHDSTPLRILDFKIEERNE